LKHRERLKAKLRRGPLELEASRARYLDLFENAPVGYFALSEPGLIRTVNLTAATMLGFPRGTLLSQPLARFIAPEDADTHYLHRKRLLETQDAQSYDVAFVRGDGQPLDTHVVATVSASRGGVHAIRVAVMDISAQRRAELARADLRAHLLQAQKMEAVGQLAGGIAHDFNNILAAAILQLNMLRRASELPRQALDEAHQDLLDSMNRAAALTKQLLLFSRRQVMRFAPLDAARLVDDVLKLLERLLGAEIQIALETSNEPLWLEGDAGMIEQVVTNLCLNARDAMPNGGRLSLSLTPLTLGAEAAQRHPSAKPGSYVCLRVADTGSGMDPSLLQHMFEPFFTTKPQGKGTGLGLATVHGIVAKHGGWVEIDSRVGHGSTFTVLLPRVPARPRTDLDPAPKTTPRGTERVLVVEDEVALRRMAVMCLRQLGYEVVEAPNGVEALKVWETERGRFDLLFTDMVMPKGVSGLELSSRLRASKPSLKVIIVSGYSAEMVGDDRTFGQDVKFLPKPYDFSTLAAAVRDCLDRHS
jgi:PAS domain S-box-containing protein